MNQDSELERARFEAWASTHRKPANQNNGYIVEGWDLTVNRAGNYKACIASYAWKGWQARAAIKPEQCNDVVEGCISLNLTDKPVRGANMTDKQTAIEAAYEAYELQLGRDNSTDEDLVKAAIKAFLAHPDNVELVARALYEGEFEGELSEMDYEAVELAKLTIDALIKLAGDV